MTTLNVFLLYASDGQVRTTTRVKFYYFFFQHTPLSPLCLFVRFRTPRAPCTASSSRPIPLGLHQQVTYLRLKQLPLRVYCANFATPLLYSIYNRARAAFCTVAPSGASHLQL